MKMIAQALVTLMLAPVASHAQNLVAQFDGGTVLAKAQFTKGPFSSPKQESALRLELLERKDGGRKVNVNVPPVVELDMKMAGQPSHGPGGVVKVVPGPAANIFDATQIYFTMPGEWTAKITLTYQDGKSETQALKVTVP